MLEASFEKILQSLLDSIFSDTQDMTQLKMTHLLFDHLCNMMTWATKIDFSDIKDPIPDYAEQKSIDTNRVKNFWQPSSIIIMMCLRSLDI